MTAMNYFSQVVYESIDDAILDLGLSREGNYIYRIQQPINILIEKRMLYRLQRDFSLSNGVELSFDIDQCYVVSTNEAFTLFRVPDNILMGRPLISINDVLSNYAIMGLPSNPQQMLEARTSGTFGAKSFVRTEVVSSNEFMVNTSFNSVTGTVRSTVGYSKNLNEISPKYHMALSNYAILCAEAYLFKTLRVKINQGAIYHGAEISIMKDIIDDYRDSNKEYMEGVNVTGSKMLLMNDKESYNDYIQTIFGGFS